MSEARGDQPTAGSPPKYSFIRMGDKVITHRIPDADTLRRMESLDRISVRRERPLRAHDGRLIVRVAARAVKQLFSRRAS